MTQNTMLADIATEIETLNANLIKINAAIEIIGKPAILKADEVVHALNDAKDRFATALADQATFERDERLGRFSDIRVEYTPGINLISTAYTIHYKQDSYDHNLRKTVPMDHKCSGFAALADNAYEYLVTVKPEAVPAEIMALAPGKPHEALSAYLAGKARGYFKVAA